MDFINPWHIGLISFRILYYTLVKHLLYKDGRRNEAII